MSATLQAQATTASAKPTFTPLPFGVIQRKCDCGGSAGISGECEECQEKQLSINRYSTDRRSPSGLLPSRAEPAKSTMLSDSGAVAWAGHHFGRLRVGAVSLSGTSGERAVSQPGDRSEVEANRAAEQVMRALSSPVFEEKQEAPEAMDLSQTPPLIQREVANENTRETEAAPETAASEETAASGLIVEDDADVGPGQMRKSDFLAQLNAAIYAAAEPILATRGRTAQSCPYITNWIGYGYTRNGSYVETFIRRFTPGSDRVATASEYIPLAVERLRQALLVWANTGEITGVPEGLADELPATNQKGAVASLGAQVGAEGEPGATGAATGAVQAKAREGGSFSDSDPSAIQNQLRGGQPLDGGVKSRMESAFGYDFSRVRVHRDANAAHLSTRLNARAFTIGHDVAFAAGEYRPGTLVGDALLAHELAHVVQQGGGQSAIAQKPPDLSASGSLEEDADRSAVGAVVALWGGAGDKLSRVSENVLPSLRSGLRLSRCDSCKSTSEKQPEGAPEKGKATVPAAPPGEGWVRNDTPGGQKFGSGDIDGTYYIDASTTAQGQKVPARGTSVIFQPNFVGAYVNFSDKSKGSNCANGSGARLWLSHKYYKELTIAGAAAPSTPLDQWTLDISGNFVTNRVDFEDLPGIPVPGKEGIAGYVRRSYHIGIVCSCTSDSTKQVKGFLSEYSFNLDLWFNGSDAAIRVSPGDSYGGPVDWCKVPPSGVTCVDACPAPASAPTTNPTSTPTTTPTEPKKTP